MDWINLALVNTVMYLWFHKMQAIWLTEKPDSEGLCRRQFTVDSTHAETRFRLSAQWMSPFKSAGASFQSTTGTRDVRSIGSNAGYAMFQVV